MSAKEIRCTLCDIRASGLFGAVDLEYLDEVDRSKTVRVYRPRQVIVYEGTPPLAVYCIRAGHVKLYKSGGRSEDHVLRILGPGDTFGARPLLANEPFAATAEAIDEAEICAMPRQVLMDLIEKCPSLAFEIMTRLSRELRISEDQLLNLAQRSVRQRAAQLLLMLADGCGKEVEGGTQISLPLQRKDMAQMIGTTPETFSRTLHDLGAKDLIVLSRSEIVIRNRDALVRIAKVSEEA
jgi:CRP-like cAMP-binding protein